MLYKWYMLTSVEVSQLVGIPLLLIVIKFKQNKWTHRYWNNTVYSSVSVGLDNTQSTLWLTWQICRQMSKTSRKTGSRLHDNYLYKWSPTWFAGFFAFTCAAANIAIHGIIASNYSPDWIICWYSYMQPWYCVTWTISLTFASSAGNFHYTRTLLCVTGVHFWEPPVLQKKMHVLKYSLELCIGDRWNVTVYSSL